MSISRYKIEKVEKIKEKKNTMLIECKNCKIKRNKSIKICPVCMNKPKNGNKYKGMKTPRFQ